MKKAYIHTLGCKLNQSESEILMQKLQKLGFSVSTRQSQNADQDLIYVNTCAVTEKAAAKSRQAINRLAREFPTAKIIVGGCLSQMDKIAVEQIPVVNQVLGTSDRYGVDLSLFGEDLIQQTDPEDFEEQISSERSRPFVKIQDGCDHWCSYCIIPGLRGPNRSISLSNILNNINCLVENGAEEIVLTGIRIGAWGLDLKPERNFKFLLREILTHTNIKRVRGGSLEPWELDEEIIEMFSDNKRLCSHLHIPLQHTVPEILKSMNRENVEEVLKLLRKARTINPQLAIGTDVIVGFPGESDEYFSRLRNDLESLPITYLHAFSFSPRKGTVAARLPYNISSEVVKERVRLIREIGDGKKHSFYSSQIGKTVDAIPDRTPVDKAFTRAISDNYLRLRVESTGAVPGQINHFKVTRFENESLYARNIEQ